MSNWIARKVGVCRRLSSHFLRNIVPNVKCRRNTKIANSDLGGASFLSPFNTLRTSISAGLVLQPSDDAPSGWLVLSAFIGLPLALWAYKVRPAAQLVGYES